MPDWCWALIGAVGAPLIGFLWQGLLSRSRTERWGRIAGRCIARLLRQRLGVAGGASVRDRFRSTVADLWKGMEAGLMEEGEAGDAKH